MDIDFIKWMCDKADGFEWIHIPLKDGSGYYVSVSNKFGGVNIDSDFFEVYITPLLLQRAIEGVNRTSIFEIIQNYGRVEIRNKTNVNSLLLDCCFCRNDNYTVDQAKESALQYIYEQELKRMEG